MTIKQEAEYRKEHIKRVCENLNISHKDYKWFLTQANRLHRIFENQCNGYQDYMGNWNQEASDKEERLEEKITKRIGFWAKELGLKYFIQGDPRGGTLYLDKKEIPYNNYTNAYCIY